MSIYVQLIDMNINGSTLFTHSLSILKRAVAVQITKHHHHHHYHRRRRRRQTFLTWPG